MKSFKLMTLTVASALLLATAACEIATEPKSTVTDANIFNDVNSYKAFIAKIYAGLGVTGQQGPAGVPDLDPSFDEGFSHYVRLVWQMNELPSDEAVIAWNDNSLQELNTMGWSSMNDFSTGMYNRVFFQVAMANEFLRETTGEKLAERGHQALAAEIADYRAEARYLRALSYWHGIDLFGDIPLVTEDFALGAQPPRQETRERVFTYVVDELTAIRSELPAAGAGEFGRADQGAVAMLLAKLYMNSEVYTGVPAWGSAMSEIEAVIAGPYTLDADYSDMFLTDNASSPELIFAVPQDGDFIRSWGGTTFLAHAACGGSVNNQDIGVDGCWWGLRIQPEIVNLFPTPDASPDGRAIFWSDGQTLSIDELTNFNNGWAALKYKNVSSEGVGGNNVTHASINYPMFRLGDAYLMYAEVALRGGGGSVGQAVTYINALRERAYGDQTGNITAGDVDLQFVLDERAREVYWEGHRRTDLIRYGMFTGGDYIWSWKGGSQAGQSVSDIYNLYPLPAAELSANPLLTQNDGY
ncbi:MAG: RagB/SusD family nutrient uptake outer membrane protein [Gemmatimonadetes bacterium]|nr:RagB/SusD family nutrient uptake outer membrane protein [Gemmatimonadota bacterium]